MTTIQKGMKVKRKSAGTKKAPAPRTTHNSKLARLVNAVGNDHSLEMALAKEMMKKQMMLHT